MCVSVSEFHVTSAALCVHTHTYSNELVKGDGAAAIRVVGPELLWIKEKEWAKRESRERIPRVHTSKQKAMGATKVEVVAPPQYQGLEGDWCEAVAHGEQGLLQFCCGNGLGAVTIELIKRLLLAPQTHRKRASE